MLEKLSINSRFRMSKSSLGKSLNPIHCHIFRYQHTFTSHLQEIPKVPNLLQGGANNSNFTLVYDRYIYIPIPLVYTPAYNCVGTTLFKLDASPSMLATSQAAKFGMNSELSQLCSPTWRFRTGAPTSNLPIFIVRFPSKMCFF